MDATLVDRLPTEQLDRSLAALARRHFRAAEQIERSKLPADTQLSIGRDGSTTIRWVDDDAQPVWLGRTTMPQVRAEAMVEAFAPGSGNVLLVGMGQGAEVAVLFQRLAPHQAVFVIEADAAAVNLALRLYDFAGAIEAGRLLVFVGADAWKDLRVFLLENHGYLAPDRVLSWPHFGHEQIHAITTQLTAVCSDVAAHRSKRMAALGTQLAAATSVKANGNGICRVVAVIAGKASFAARQLAYRLTSGATVCGAACETFDYSLPDRVHPLAVEEALTHAPPDRVILIDAVPADLSCRLPCTPVSIILTHDYAIASDWLRRIPSDSRLIARSDRQHRAAIDAGFAADRIDLCPPAALTNIQPSTSNVMRTIALLATQMDQSAAAAGLHLPTHARLYEKVAQLADRRIDALRVSDGDSLLKESEKSLGISVHNATVRTGLIERIARHLIPAVIVEAFSHVAREPGGEGGESIQIVRASEASQLAADVGLLVVLDPVTHCVDAILDAIARGVCIAVRRYDDTLNSALSDVLNIDAHLLSFDSREELKEMIEQFRRDPTVLTDRATVAAAHVRAKHTWVHRMRAICSPTGTGKV